MNLFKEFEHDGVLPVAIVGIVGGPGAGKGTQCERLTQRLPIEHLSIGDTLRAEMETEGSRYAEIISENMAAGRIGPPELTVGLLRRRMEAAVRNGTRTFILDGMCALQYCLALYTHSHPGFPRNMVQCEYLESRIAPIIHIFVLECSDSTLTNRLSSSERGRFDDNKENIERRIKTFRESTSEVISIFESRNKVTRIDGENNIEAITADLEQRLRRIVKEFGT